MMRSILFLFAACSLLDDVHAQLPDWASIPTPPSATIRLEQSWATVEEPGMIQAFSSINRRWTKQPILHWPSLTVLNEAFLVKDGNLVYGYSPRTGQFAPQFTWSANAVVVPPVSPQTWFAIVTDGDMIHVYQALDGVWTSYALAGPPQVTMATKCAIVEDGSDVYAVSAFYGTPVRLQTNNGKPTVQGAFGNCAIATTPGIVHGFSAYRNQWSSAPVSSVLAVRSGHQQAAFAVVEEGNAFTFFSGHTGTFTRIAAVSATPSLVLQRSVAVVDDFPLVHAYSGLLARTSLRPATGTPAIRTEQFFALVADAGGVAAFSATTGTFAPPVAGSLDDISTTAGMAVLQPATSSIPTQVYSHYRNAWVPTPNLAAAATYKTAASVVLVEPGGGVHGLSLRGGQWIFQPTPAIDTVFVGTSRPLLEMTLVAKAGTSLWAFNPRTQAWRATTTDAPATLFHGNNSALVVTDGTKAYGFSNWNDRWSAQPLAAPAVRASAQVQAAYVDDGLRVHAYSGIGQTSASHDYPEYWRAATQGARMRVDLAGDSGALGAMLVGLAPASIPIPGLGLLLVDPATAMLLATPVLPPSGIFGLPLQVPIAPGLTGIDLHFQSAVLGIPAPYLTNSVVVRIL